MMNSNEIIDLLDPPEAELHVLLGTGSSLQEQLDEYIEAMQLKISDAMRMKLLTIYRNEHNAQ